MVQQLREALEAVLESLTVVEGERDAAVSRLSEAKGTGLQTRKFTTTAVSTQFLFYF